MIAGQITEKRRSFSWGAVIFLVIAVVLLGLGIGLANVHWTIAAILPLLIAGALWLAREPPFAAHFTEAGLEVGNPPTTIPYSEIEGLRIGGRAIHPGEERVAAGPIDILHSGGVARIPDGIDASAEEIYRFLYAGLTTSGNLPDNPQLAKYYRRQVESHGPEEVWCFRARKKLRASQKYRRWRAAFLAVVVTGIIWIVIGGVRPEPGWLAAGFVVGLLGGLFSFLFWAASRGSAANIRNWQQSGLVIGPDGLALVQGDMRGEMRWEELLDVRFKQRPGFFDTPQALRGIQLVVAGATITIADIYDRPLAVIYDRIRACRE
jgi:hypothetical protein